MQNFKTYVDGQGWLYPHQINPPEQKKPNLDDLFNLYKKARSLRDSEAVTWTTRNPTRADDFKLKFQ